MKTREDVIKFCKTFNAVYEDYPFDDYNWTVMRHIKNKKTFALIYERNGKIWINVKCDPEIRDLQRAAFKGVVPAYHMNKEHWNSVILTSDVPTDEIESMIAESYNFTKPAIPKKQKK